MGIPQGTTMSRPAKKRLAKNRKKHWKKGTDIAEVETYLHDKAHDEAHGGALAERLDDELFTIDKLPTAEKAAKKETVKQKAYMKRREERLKQMVKVEEPEPSERAQKKAQLEAKIKSKQTASVPVSRPKKVVESKGQYDLWETDLAPDVNMEDEDAVEHFLSQTKKKQPKMPGSMRHVSSLLPKVQIAMAGSSYNPTSEDYSEYVKQFAEEELKLQEQDAKLEKRMRLRDGDKYITAAEKLAEQMQGLESGDENDVDNDDEKAKGDADSAVEPNTIKPSNRIKTEKQRRVAKFEKLKLLLAKQEKSKKQLDNDVFKAPKLTKEIRKQLAKLEENAKLRRKRKAITKLTTRQKLGRGEFEKFEEPFLLEQELSSSLRTMQAPGGTTVLKDRLRSMQMRNLLPVPGDKPKRVLKKKLKAKLIEKRSVKEVVQGSKVF
ncbi:hypothetical protein QR680_005645 [Steinernema hermaphroditum]|uniref:Ribosome biogenesis protein NOP53 n=1 Tax=Steinernema hermaphroditum TaxID=289476 RepID=A0AA39LV95_9BILA|nr:hypothetical protein QR680_005645 [Steinernema hermaphroditum]